MARKVAYAKHQAEVYTYVVQAIGENLARTAIQLARRPAHVAGFRLLRVLGSAILSNSTAPVRPA